MSDLVIFLKSWYFVVIFLGSLFLYLTRTSWKRVISQLAIQIRTKFFKADRNPTGQGKVFQEYKRVKGFYKKMGVKDFDQLNILFEEKDKQIEESKTARGRIFELWKYYMFSYFNLFLVPHSKIALLWFYSNPNSSKEEFLSVVYIPSNIKDINIEKGAVFSALLSNSLIEKGISDKFSITNMGKDFLQFVGLIKNQQNLIES